MMEEIINQSYIKSCSIELLEQIRSIIEVELRERDLLRSEEETKVHAAHCCATHGCKYSDSNCPVTLGTVIQMGPCMDCEHPHPTLWTIPDLDEPEPTKDPWEWNDVDTYGS